MPSTDFPQSSGIIPSPGITPPTGAQVTPNFDYSGGSYAPRPDTISSMATFAKKNAKWLAIGTFLLGALYFLWSIFTRKPPTPPTDDTELERRLTPPVSTSPRLFRVDESDPQVIIGKEDVKWSDVALQYRMLYVNVVRQNNISMSTCSSSALMNTLGSSESFKRRIRETTNPCEDRIDAFRELIEAIIETYGMHLEEYEIGNQKLPKEYYTKDTESGEYPIVTAFAKLMQK